jgi:NitT/TauT family transport system ATP-binding protein
VTPQAANHHPLLSAQHVSHAYENGSGTVEALRDVSLALRHGEFACLVGPSGCGKSTLLHVLAGLLIPTEGTVMLGEEVVNRPRRRIGVVFQDANLMPWRTALDNVALPLELRGVAHADREAAAREQLALVGLAGFEDAYPSGLSGGMAQRVAIARALITRPDVLLLDEPFGALDALTREQLGEELLRIWSAGETSAVLMVTHSITEAILLADRVLVMSPRPGHVGADFPVDLPRPRALDMLHRPETGTLASAIRAAIRAEPRDP